VCTTNPDHGFLTNEHRLSTGGRRDEVQSSKRNCLGSLADFAGVRSYMPSFHRITANYKKRSSRLGIEWLPATSQEVMTL
jgi:hypothetical protein